VTAGPTFEPIDPVRFIGNHSSGKMGFAIARQLAESGAKVELVTGPVSLTISHPQIHRTDVNTADEMYDACVKIFPGCRGAILSAAVADFRPAEKSELKIKKTEQDKEILALNLVKNKDILATLGNMKTENQLLVGFSLETHDEFKFAFEKLKKKNCDLMVMNSLRDEGAGFSGETNKVNILTSDGETFAYPKKTKNEVATDIVEFIIRRYF
jgi:phosphopantothenoylcysteine decarboxylase/phosphopantothenate--cysteine ligase